MQSLLLRSAEEADRQHLPSPQGMLLGRKASAILPAPPLVITGGGGGDRVEGVKKEGSMECLSSASKDLRLLSASELPFDLKEGPLTTGLGEITVQRIGWDVLNGLKALHAR